MGSFSQSPHHYASPPAFEATCSALRVQQPRPARRGKRISAGELHQNCGSKKSDEENQDRTAIAQIQSSTEQVGELIPGAVIPLSLLSHLDQKNLGLRFDSKMALTQNNQVTLSKETDEVLSNHIQALSPLLKARNLSYVGFNYDAASKQIFFGLTSINPKLVWPPDEYNRGADDVEKLIDDAIKKVLEDLSNRERIVMNGEHIYEKKGENKKTTAIRVESNEIMKHTGTSGLPIASILFPVTKEMKDAGTLLDPYLKIHSRHYKTLCLINHELLPILKSENPAAFVKLLEQKPVSTRLRIAGKVTDVTEKFVIIDDNFVIKKSNLEQVQLGDTVALDCSGRIDNLPRLIIDEIIDLQIPRPDYSGWGPGWKC